MKIYRTIFITFWPRPPNGHESDLTSLKIDAIHSI